MKGMKPFINPTRVSLLKYDIRALVVIADKLQALGAKIWAWENIGDPIKQGHQVPAWIKQALKQAADDNDNWGYSPTEGVLAAREFIAAQANKSGFPLDKNDIVFTSGLGQGINILYQVVSGSDCRIIQPAPVYPAHSSTESFFAGQPAIFYQCDPANNWQPDLNDLEEKIKKHPDIGFILIIAPNNPTGVCYSDEVLRGLADLARKYQLGIISDETYIQLVYQNEKQSSLIKIMLEGAALPLVVMRSMSKDVPWPGGRAGWLEFYNLGHDKNFAEFIETIKQALRVQVCSTTMVQAVLPKIYGDPRYQEHRRQFIAKIEEQSRYIADQLNVAPGLSCVRGQSAFYLSPIFKPGILKPNQTLAIGDKNIKGYVESLAQNSDLPLDKRFALYLMAAKGIFLIPLSSFEGPLGFRVTTLKTDLAETRKVYSTLKSAVEEYLES
jgi:aspartate/methionine/tyrosine aminotransferase